MPHLDRTPLGGGVLARRWYVDVNNGTYGAPDWKAVNGVEDFSAPLDPSVMDDSDYDSGGYKSSTITAIGWTINLKLARKVTAASGIVYDPGQEILRLASVNMGAANRVDVRWYEVTASGPITEAYRGYAAVSWSEDGGGMDALAAVTVALTGQGARETYVHPDFALAAPAIYSVTPSTVAAAGGTLIHIVGSGFFKAGINDVTAVTGVKLVAHNCTSWTVESDQSIWAITPAEAAGASNVNVTNSTGTSSNFVITSA